MQRFFVFLLLSSLAVSTGCAGFLDYRRERREIGRKLPSTTDSLWKGGYGFNNPNPDRIRNGLEPMNFDGSLDSERKSRDSFASRLLGDMIGYGLTSTFRAIGDRLRR